MGGGKHYCYYFIKLKKKSQCYALTWNIAFWLLYQKDTLEKQSTWEREDENDGGMEKIFSCEKKLERLGLFREREVREKQWSYPK